MISPWPEAEEAQLDAEAEADMELLMDLIRQIRNARAEFDVTPGKRIPAIVVGGSQARRCWRPSAACSPSWPRWTTTN